MWREAHDAGECRRKKALQPLARGLPELWRGFLARGAQQQAEQNQAAGERSNGEEGGRNSSHGVNVSGFDAACKHAVVFCSHQRMESGMESGMASGMASGLPVNRLAGRVKRPINGRLPRHKAHKATSLR